MNTLKMLAAMAALVAAAWGQSSGAGAIAISQPPPSSGPGSGDVVGPASSTDSAWALWDGTTGKLLKNSDVTYSSPTLTVPDAFNILSAGSIDLTSTSDPINLNAGSSGVRLSNSVTAGLQLYNTTDQTTNYERLDVSWGNNSGLIQTTIGGSGTRRSLTFRSASGALNIQTIGSGFNAGTNGVNITTLLALSNTSGTAAIASITPTYNQASGTASNTDLLINRTQTAVGSGAQLLIDAQVGSVSKFKVSNTGTTTLAGPLIQSVSALTYASPTSVDVTLANVYTVTTVNATGSVTFNATAGGTAGQEITFIITNDATSAKTITFGSNFTANGTLTASGVSKKTTIQFISDGSSFIEITRTVLP